MIDQNRLGSMISWLVAGAQPPKSIDEIVEECALRLTELGVQVDSFVINGLFIHPQIRGVRVGWSRKRGRSRTTFSHEFMESSSFQDEPTAECLRTRRVVRHRLRPQDRPQDRPREGNYLTNFIVAGYTDMVLMPLFNFDGTVTGAMEVGTRREGGLTEDQILALRRVQAPIARMKEYFTEHYDKRITLATYVGEETSREILKGNIVLGGGELISAVVLFADIVDFTRLSNTRPSEQVLETLNRFFAAFDDAVGRNNGEILKFMGDGALAIFKTPDDLTAQEAAARSALDAIASARAALAQEPEGAPIRFRSALHVGEVFFGNIGSKSRLDFTAIGPTVNLASRMLGEASVRDASSVCSQEFRQLLGAVEAESIECRFKGFEQPETIFVLS